MLYTYANVKKFVLSNTKSKRECYGGVKREAKSPFALLEKFSLDFSSSSFLNPC